jgi:hypothetical protein
VDVCSTCGLPATLAWQRYATAAEETAEITRIRRAIVALAQTSPAAARARIAALALTHLRPMSLMVFGCDLHKLDPETAALVQGTPTVAPPPPPPIQE